MSKRMLVCCRFGVFLVVLLFAFATPADATIVSFTASPSPIAPGGSSTLFFSTSGTTSVTIDNGVGNVPAGGSVTVTPSSTTVFTLTANGPGGTTTATARVEVITQPAILVVSFPTGLLQAAGTGGATDRYVLTNIGGSATSITLARFGSFFTQSPTSFTIASGGSQTVTLTGLALAAGTYLGVSIPNGNGVPLGLTIPIRLLSAPPPGAGTVIPVASSHRLDITAPSGSVQVTNSGTTTLTGILVPDVPWIIPQGGVITIAPGTTLTRFFLIDRSKRPDGAAPIGSLSGNLILVYLDATGGNASRPITVVDTAALPTAGSAIPPFAAGEVAFFIPGFTQRTGIVSDLALVNALAPAALNDVRLFYATSGTGGAAATSAPISTLSPNISVQFASAVKTVFNRNNEAGSLQVRSQSASDKLSLSAGIFSTLSPRGFFGGTLPVFRSDRSVGFGEKLFLPGVKKDGSTRSDLYLQETAGQSGSAQTEFVDAPGIVLASRIDAIPAFGMLELLDAAPAGAVSAVVTNLSATGRLAAHAVVFDSVTSDAGSVVDWNRKNGTQGSEAQLIPLAETKAGPVTTRTEVVIMNGGASTASGTLTFTSAVPSDANGDGTVSVGDVFYLINHLFASGPGPVGPSDANGDAAVTVGDVFYLINFLFAGGPPPSGVGPAVTITLGPGETRVLSDALGSDLGLPSGASGYLVFTPSSGSVAITSRTVSSANGQPGFFGASIPSVALAAGLRAGRTQKFTNLEDAAPANVAAKKAGTFRSGFGLIETTGSSVLVRATLRYAAALPGGLANVRAVASKEYQLAPRGAVTVSDLAREILGAGRDAIGDLHNLQLDFDVVSGEGAVVPYTISTDNGSGDPIVRIE